MRMPIILCDCCSSKALIYQWDKWLCQHWRREIDKKKRRQYKQLMRRM